MSDSMFLEDTGEEDIITGGTIMDIIEERTANAKVTMETIVQVGHVMQPFMTLAPQE
jgi:hypothetical protein